MSGLRRLLMKESGSNKAEDFGKGVKKSPSAGNVPSYWSRLSSNQPSFLRRFFEKVHPTTNAHPPKHDGAEEGGVLEIGVEPEVEPILSMSVAEKATHFMKLEHNQRFSKWRNLETLHNGAKRKEEPAGARCSDFPIADNKSRCLSATAALRIPTLENLPTSPRNPKKVFESSTDDGTEENGGRGRPLTSNSEPSKLSLKDRVHMFNRISSGTGKSHVNMAAADVVSHSHGGGSHHPKSVKNNLPSTARAFRSSGSNSSLNHHPISIQDIDSSYDNLTAFPLFSNHSTKDFPSSGTFQSYAATANQRLPQSLLPSSNPIPMVRNNIRVKSMFVSHSADNNDLSEDGEVSSGGMEVAEIISKSYENSPL